MSRLTVICEWLIRRPAVWGGMACFAFYALAVHNAPADGALSQAFTGEGSPLKIGLALMFFMALAEMGLRLMGLAAQYGALQHWLAASAAADPADGPPLAATTPHDAHRGDDYLGRRLALMEPSSAPSSWPADLAGRLSLLGQHDRYMLRTRLPLVRAARIALPALGLIGLAGGLIEAAARFAAAGGADAAPGAGHALQFVVLSAALSLLLELARIPTEKAELRLIEAVDEAVCRQLAYSPPAIGAGDPAARHLMRQCEKLLETVQNAVAQHDAALHKAVSGASKRWEEAAATAAGLLHRTIGDALAAGLAGHAQSLTDGVAKFAAELENVLLRHAQILSENVDAHAASLADALEHHTAVMTQTEANLAEENRRHLADVEAALGEAMVVAATRQEKLIKQSENLMRDMQTALVDSAGTAVAHQEQLVRQSEVLLKVVEAVGQIRQLEEALNGNLAALAASHRFEETVVGLSAALQLLSAHLGRTPNPREEVSLHATRSVSQAA
ncbi:MAG: hypothetical protein IT424_06040 [Pirellulales bacterium]|nr:hypothetical protein [Pirellulales bacterium]